MHNRNGMTVFEFVIVSGLRAAQLMRGSVPRVKSTHKRIVTAQMEVAAGVVMPVAAAAPAAPKGAGS